MTRVIVISQLPPPLHGSTVMTKALLDTFDRLQVDWRLLDRRFSATISDVGRFSLRKLLSAFAMPFRLVLLVLQFRPQGSIFFVTNRPFSFLVDWLLSEVLRPIVKARVVYVHTLGYTALAARGPIWRWLVGRLLSSASDIVCLGPSLVTDVAVWAPRATVTCIANTVSDYPDELRGPGRRANRTVAYLSNLIPEKGVSDFVDLAIMLRAVDPSIVFSIAGATPSASFAADLVERVRKSGNADGVSFLGPIVDPLEKWSFLRSASVLVFPSVYKFEAQPVTILEALAVGTPVAAYEVGGVADVIREGVDGYLVPPGDLVALRDRVTRLLNPPFDSDAHRRRIASGFQENFSRDAFESQWAALLNRIIR